jgi:hypothetical protein
MSVWQPTNEAGILLMDKKIEKSASPHGAPEGPQMKSTEKLTSKATMFHKIRRFTRVVQPCLWPTVAPLGVGADVRLPLPSRLRVNPLVAFGRNEGDVRRYSQNKAGMCFRINGRMVAVPLRRLSVSNAPQSGR